jgi:hypothetical protein
MDQPLLADIILYRKVSCLAEYGNGFIDLARDVITNPTPFGQSRRSSIYCELAKIEILNNSSNFGVTLEKATRCRWLEAWAMNLPNVNASVIPY